MPGLSLQHAQSSLKTRVNKGGKEHEFEYLKILTESRIRPEVKPLIQTNRLFPQGFRIQELRISHFYIQMSQVLRASIFYSLLK